MASDSLFSTKHKNDNSGSKKSLILNALRSFLGVFSKVFSSNMIKKITKYPTPLSLEYGTDVRVFNEKLFSLLDNLKDTIKENNLNALSAYQIGSYFNVIVFQDENDAFIEMINPVQISHTGESIKEESCYYYGDITAQVKRFENISIIYEDREGNSKSLKFSGDMARVLQRKLDYLFGSSLIDRLSSSEKEKFESKLEFGTDIGKDNYCPTTFKRDKLLKIINVLMIVMLLVVAVSLFINTSLWQYQLYTSFGVLALQISYFFYAQYEGKQYSSCVSCSIGNIIGTTVISMVRLSGVMLLSYFFT